MFLNVCVRLRVFVFLCLSYLYDLLSICLSSISENCKAAHSEAPKIEHRAL